jgi:hypothetical protein
MEGSERIEIWEPGKHLRIAHDRAAGAPPSVVDYFIEGRRGSTVMRLVHSGFGAGADFDEEFNTTRTAWPVFLQMMKHSVEGGIGAARNVSVFRFLSEAKDAAWAKLTQRVGRTVDGIVRHFDPAGCLCYEFPARHGAMLRIFCEKCSASTAITPTWLLYDATADEAEKVREQWASILNEIFGQPVAA